MKKIFSICAAMLVALAVNAKVINIDNTTPDILRTTLAAATTEDGDVIVMAAGTYEESNGNYIAFDAKNIVVKAAEGAEVILKPHVPITIAGGARAEFNGIKIDASELQKLSTDYEHLIYPDDAAAGNRLILEGCEIYGFNVCSSLIHCESGKLDSVNINNCYFHNILKSILFVEGTDNLIGLKVTNSTIANITTVTNSYWAGIFDVRTSTAKIIMDHCTCYSCEVMNTDYGVIGKTDASVEVSNCIFAMPASTGGMRAIRGGGGTATKCLIWNYTEDSGYAIRSAVSKVDCIKDQDPLFADAANGDFHLQSGSPAIDAGSDGKSLGDPRWWPGSSTAIDNTVESVKAVKMFENGQLVIIKNGVKYNAQGATL